MHAAYAAHMKWFACYNMVVTLHLKVYKYMCMRPHAGPNHIVAILYSYTYMQESKF